MNANRDALVRLIIGKGTINERFTTLVLISDKGHFSILLKAYDKLLKKEVALKFFDPYHRSDEYRLRCFHREAEILGKLKGQRNIVELIEGLSRMEIVLKDTNSGAEITNYYEYIVLELASGDIEGYIYNTNDETIDTAIDKLICFREMCKGVARIHRVNTCHRDLKLTNFLIFKKEIKLSDLGTATTVLDGRVPFQSEYVDPVGDLGYCAPELFCGIGISDGNIFSSDVFSLGAILFEMFTKTRLSLKIYNKSLLESIVTMRSSLSLVKQPERVNFYDGLVDSMVSSHRLPDMFAYNNAVPRCIKNNLNDLYKGLVALNYRKRLTDFASIMRQINICILIVQNERAQKLRATKK